MKDESAPDTVGDDDAVLGLLLTEELTRTGLPPLAVVERQYILRVLESVGGNKTVAARVLRVGRKTLYRKLEKYGLGSADSATKVSS